MLNLNKILRHRSIVRARPSQNIFDLEFKQKFNFKYFNNINNCKTFFSKLKPAINTNTKPLTSDNSYLPFNPSVKISFYSKAQVSKDSYVLRFLLPDSDYSVGFKTCQYIILEDVIADEAVKKPYHPISLDVDKGFIDILIKVYTSDNTTITNTNSNKDSSIFGQFSNHLMNLQVFLLNLT